MQRRRKEKKSLCQHWVRNRNNDQRWSGETVNKGEGLCYSQHSDLQAHCFPQNPYIPYTSYILQISAKLEYITPVHANAWLAWAAAIVASRLFDYQLGLKSLLFSPGCISLPRVLAVAPARLYSQHTLLHMNISQWECQGQKSAGFLQRLEF